MSSVPRSIALIDCNNFYVSCERVFRPDLLTRPVIVLSGNDGCIISRSNEAKALGIRMGAPLFQMQELIQGHDVTIFSSNHVLYADMSNRVMSTLQKFSPVREIYSIDEIFLDLSGFADINSYAATLRHQVIRDTAIPVCAGIAPTKTLAKLANLMAKRHPRSTGVFNLNNLTEKQINSVLSHIPINEIWGIGRQLTASLNLSGIYTAAQLRDAPASTMRQRFGVITEKTIRELRGECCIELGETTPARQQILNSRSFGSTVTDIADLQDAIIHFVSHVAKKCRDQHSVASILQIFIQTDRFRTDRPQYCPSISIPLTTPSANTITLGKLALQGLDSIYQTGYHYKRAGVILSEISHAAQSQGDLFAADTSKPELMKTLDALNRRYGKGTVTLGQEGAQHAWQTRQENKSPEYSTNWDQLPVCR